LNIRSGIVFLGEPFTGKTSTIQMVKNIIHKKGIEKWNAYVKEKRSNIEYRMKQENDDKKSNKSENY